MPSGEKLDDSAKQQLTRGFAEGYPKFKDEPRVQSLLKLVEQYTDLLKQYGLKDYMVAKRMRAAVDSGEQTLVDRTTLLMLVAKRLGLLTFWCLCWIPAGLLSIPFVLVTRHVAKKKAAEAVAKSSVKVAGRDVVATWKVLVAIGLWPIMHFVYTLAMYLIKGKVWAVMFFFFMPFLSLGNLKSQDNIAKLFQSIAPLMLLMRNPQLAEDLVLLREACRKETTAVVEEVGWGVRMHFETEHTDLVRQESDSSGGESFGRKLRSNSWGDLGRILSPSSPTHARTLSPSSVDSAH